MFKIVSELSENGYIEGTGYTCNEDRIFSSDYFLVVVDGATGLNGIYLTNEGSDAAWLSKNLCDFLIAELSDIEMTVPEILKKTAKQLKSRLDKMGYENISNSYPSAGIAIVRQNRNFLECFSLGDVPILISDKNGNTICICDEALSNRDEQVIKRMKEIHLQTGCSVAEARKMVSDILLKNRLEMNQDGAYYVFDPTGAGIDYITTDTIPLENISDIALMTDGYYAALSCFNIVKSQDEFMNLLGNGKAKEIFNSIKSLAFEDRDLNEFPRFKVMDDASVIVANIKP